MFLKSFKIIQELKWLTILLVFIVFACEKDIDYQIEKQQTQIVMYSFPFADSILRVHASYTTSILDINNYDTINSVGISVYVDNFLRYAGNYSFVKEWRNIDNFKPEEGQRIRVEYAVTNRENVIASTTIPYHVNIESIDTLSVTATGENGEDVQMLKCLVELDDPVLIDNYYQLVVRVEKLSNIGGGVITLYQDDIPFVKDDKVFFIREDESSLFRDIDFHGMFTDELFKGKNYKISLLIPKSYYIEKEEDNKVTLRFYLHTLSQEYYEYNKSIILEDLRREYPLFEPVNIYSNVDNGLGVVAGVSCATDSIITFISEP